MTDKQKKFLKGALGVGAGIGLAAGASKLGGRVSAGKMIQRVKGQPITAFGGAVSGMMPKARKATKIMNRVRGL